MREYDRVLFLMLAFLDDLQELICHIDEMAYMLLDEVEGQLPIKLSRREWHRKYRKKQ